MARTDITFETGALGTAIAAPDLASPSAGSIIYDATHVLHGSKSAKFTPVASAATGNVLIPATGLSTNTLAFTFGMWFDAANTADHYVASVYDTAGVRMFSLVRNAVNRFRIYDQTGSTGAAAPYTSVQDVPLGQWVIAKIRLGVGGTATTGTAKLELRNQAGTLLEPIINLTTANIGTVLINQFRLGRVDVSTYGTPFWIDTVSYDQAATDTLADFSGSTALAASMVCVPSSAVIPFTTTATVTASGGTGTTKNYAWVWGDGGTTAAQTSNVATHLYTTVGSYTVTCTVTNT